MPLWGNAHASATNKPKFLPADEDSDYNRADCYATQEGWVMQAGHTSSGNGNTSATPEVLVAIGGLAGATASTGLHHPTMTKYRVITSADHGTSNNIVFEITYDEKVKYTAGTAATLVLTAGSGTNATATLTHVDGSALADGTTGNTLRFTATSNAATTYDLADDVAMSDPDLSDAITTTNLEADSITFTAARKALIGYSQITISA